MNYQNQDNVFVGIIDNDGTIYQFANHRKGAVVGIDMHREKEMQGQIGEMQEIIENYYQKLIEVGVIVPEKTPAEIAQAAAEEQLEIARQQAEINTSLLDAVKTLQSEIQNLKNKDKKTTAKTEGGGDSK